MKRQATSTTDPPNDALKQKKKKRLRTKDMDPNVLSTRRKIQQCCATNDWSLALDIYQDAVRQDIRMEAQTYNNLLNLCDGLGPRQVHVGTPKTSIHRDETDKEEHNKKSDTTTTSNTDVSIQQRRDSAFQIKQRMQELQIPLSENAYTALIRILIRNGELKKAHSLFQQALVEKHMKPKLRLYSCLLLAFCHDDKMYEAIEIWNQLHEQGFGCTEKELQGLAACAVKTGHVQVYQRVLGEIANLVLVPSRETVCTIVQWFESQHAIAATESDNKETPLTLPPTNSLDDDTLLISGPVQSSAGWRISYGCRVDHQGVFTSGRLASAGNKLQPVALSPNTWRTLQELNETIVTKGMLDQDTSEFQGGGKGKKRCHDLKTRQDHWKAFTTFCEKQQQQQASGPIWNVVLDGANIGYYQQNFANAPPHVDYQQIDWVIQYFVERNQRVLLVLHQRHFSSKLLPERAIPIVTKWDKILYKTPFGCNDDWFWLHAALYSGPNTLVVTNDEMRDHYFQMLTHSHLQRWKERHLIHFQFGPWDPLHQRRTVQLTYPQPYSRRIQRIPQDDNEDRFSWVIPLAKRGDENRFLDGTHVATDQEPEEETYVCIQPK